MKEPFLPILPFLYNNLVSRRNSTFPFPSLFLFLFKLRQVAQNPILKCFLFICFIIHTKTLVQCRKPWPTLCSCSTQMHQPLCAIICSRLSNACDLTFAMLDKQQLKVISSWAHLVVQLHSRHSRHGDEGWWSARRKQAKIKMQKISY